MQMQMLYFLVSSSIWLMQKPVSDQRLGWEGLCGKSIRKQSTEPSFTTNNQQDQNHAKSIDKQQRNIKKELDGC